MKENTQIEVLENDNLIEIDDQPEVSDKKILSVYEKEISRPSKPVYSCNPSDPFSFPPGSRIYQNALMQKILNMEPKEAVTTEVEEESTTEVESTTTKRRGRPPGSKNKPKALAPEAEVGSKTRGRKPSLKKLREKLGLNQVQMAQKLGVTQAMVSLVEGGKAKASSELQNKIVSLYVG